MNDGETNLPTRNRGRKAPENPSAVPEQPIPPTGAATLNVSRKKRGLAIRIPHERSFLSTVLLQVTQLIILILSCYNIRLQVRFITHYSLMVSFVLRRATNLSFISARFFGRYSNIIIKFQLVITPFCVYDSGVLAIQNGWHD